MRKKLSELFRYKWIQKSYCLTQFFSDKEPDEILGKLSSSSASCQLFLLLLNGHWVFCKDQKQTRSSMGQDCLSHLALLCTERVYFNRVDIEKVTDEFPSRKNLFKFFFQRSLDQKSKSISEFCAFQKES